MSKIDRWKNIIPQEELAAYAKSALGSKIGLGNRAALVNVDTHNLFVDPRYAFCGAEMPGVLAGLKSITELFRDLDLPIYYVRRDDWSHPTKCGVRNYRFRHIKSGESTDIRDGHDPDADEWPASYAPRKQDVIVYKNKPSAFFATPLEAWLRYDQIDSLVVCGISTSGCVRATVCDAFSHNFRVIVAEEACGDRSPTAHKANLFDMDMKYADVESISTIRHNLTNS
jgi:maleamate amidohydrolase